MKTATGQKREKILAHNGRKIVYVTTDKSYAIKIAPPTAQGQEYYTTCAIIGAQFIVAQKIKCIPNWLDVFHLLLNLVA
ncbi:MAG: hypothetical protein FRX49_11176 [Trebouxia sp. A1-2]|nr:MAG: hypothetical protein FRX49_11176 [Trebouxia sp. A1-2]